MRGRLKRDCARRRHLSGRPLRPAPAAVMKPSPWVN